MRKKAQRDTEAPRSNRIDQHDRPGAATASDDAPAEDHILDLGRSIQGKNDEKRFPDLEAHKHTVEDEITEEVLKHTDALNLLCSIPGIDVTAAAAIIAEIGTDMSSFPDSQHICSWAGLSPGNNESAGKRKSVHINKGNPYLKSMLCEVAWIMASHRKLYLSGWYWKVKQRKGAKRATIALARKILSIIYTMLKTGTPYNEECFEQRRLRCERKRANRLVNELQKLGYVVVAPD